MHKVAVAFNLFVLELVYRLDVAQVVRSVREHYQVKTELRLHMVHVFGYI